MLLGGVGRIPQQSQESSPADAFSFEPPISEIGQALSTPAESSSLPNGVSYTDWYFAAKDAGILPLCGIEFYVCHDLATVDKNRKNGHLMKILMTGGIEMPEIKYKNIKTIICRKVSFINRIIHICKPEIGF